MPHNKRKISAEEAALFRSSVGRVTRHRQDKVEPTNPRPLPIPRQTLHDNAMVLREMMSDTHDPADLETGEELLFSRAGLQHKLLRRLRRGEFRVDAELDLHGKTVVEARAALAQFLHRCRRSHARCVRLIHGKGLGSKQKLPVLKHKLNAWLRQRDEVLAFCSARPVDGGTGALYVLLKR